MTLRGLPLNPRSGCFIQLPLGDICHFAQQPRQDLRPFVREILWVRSNAPRTQLLLPEMTLTLVLRLGGEASMAGVPLPAAIISGLQPRARTVDHGQSSSVVIVRFTEVGAPAILHDRADLLYGKTAPLDAFLSAGEIDTLRDRLSEAARIDAHIPIVERFLAARLRRDSTISPPLAAAANMIRDSRGTLSVQTLARRAAMSQSALERQLRATAGATPKMLSRLARLQQVCRLWDAGKNLTTIAFEAGYTDQPHMVRDFRLFTGLSPERFFRNHSPRNLPNFYK